MPNMTIRLTDQLKDQATEYAQALGISLNALVSVALRDYLDSRKAVATISQVRQPAVQPQTEPESEPDLDIEPMPVGAKLSESERAEVQRVLAGEPPVQPRAVMNPPRPGQPGKSRKGCRRR